MQLLAIYLHAADLKIRGRFFQQVRLCLFILFDMNIENR